jgi:D-3-phosphoglycerate dehydrogenase
LTEKAMNGEMHFMDALEERIKILNASVDDLKSLSKVLNDKITPSLQENIDFFKDNAQNTFIVSGGFTELIYSTVKEIGIPKNNIFANFFTFDDNNKIIGVDKSQFLAQKLGKVDAVQSLKLDGTVYAIGDGWTDYQIKEAGLADYFITFTEIVERPAVIKKGDIIATSFYDVIEFINSTKK